MSQHPPHKNGPMPSWTLANKVLSFYINSTHRSSNEIHLFLPPIHESTPNPMLLPSLIFQESPFPPNGNTWTRSFQIMEPFVFFLLGQQIHYNIKRGKIYFWIVTSLGIPSLDITSHRILSASSLEKNICLMPKPPSFFNLPRLSLFTIIVLFFSCSPNHGNLKHIFLIL